MTGASRGIGKATALEFARNGARVVVAARSAQEGAMPGTIAQTVREIEALGAEAMAVKTDVTQDADVEQLVGLTLERYGRVDVLVNNAGLGRQSGVGLPTTITAASMAAWDLVISVNLRGPILCSSMVVPVMIRQGGGSVINVSSVFSLTPAGVTKAAIDRFTIALANELRDRRVAVNALCPDFTRSDGFRTEPASSTRDRWQEPEMWGRYAVFVAGQRAEDLTGRHLTATDIEEMMEARNEA